MITLELSPKKLNAQFPFNGDESKTWLCRIVDSNLGTDGDPVVNFVRYGMVDMTFQPRQLNTFPPLKCIFYEAHEKVASEELEVASVLAASTPKWMLDVLAKLALVSKKLAFATLVLFALSTVFAAIQYADKGNVLGWFFEKWEGANAANGARVISEKVGEVHNRLTESIWDTPGIKAIEEENGVKFKDLFVQVPGSPNLFVMGDLIRDKDGDAILMSHGDAEDACDEFSGSLLKDEQLLVILKLSIKIGIYSWSGTPEWASDSYGFLSDDYMVHLKGGEVPDNGFKENGKVYGDSEDVKVAARCAFMRSTFEE